MSDDRERRIHDAFHRGSLPPAPASLVDALERIPDAPVRSRRSSRGRPWFGLLVAAALITTLGALAIGGGSLPRPGPSTATVGPSSSPATAAGLRLDYQVLPFGGKVPDASDLASIVSILEARIAATGAVGATVQASGVDRVVVTLPGITDSEPIERLLGQTGRVDFVPLDSSLATPSDGQTIDLVQHPPLFGGDQIASAAVGADQNDRPAIVFTFKPEGARLFADHTTQHIGSYFAITFDGVAIAVPVIQSAIRDGNVQITGGGVNGFDQVDVSTIVAIVDSGPLPFPLQKVAMQPSGGGTSP